MSARSDSSSRDGWYALRWCEDAVRVLDQRRLPAEEHYLTLRDGEAVALAIESLAVRGAPLIGCAAAMGLARAALDCRARTATQLALELEPHFERLSSSRPTAINLSWALRRMRRVLVREVAAPDASVEGVRARLVAEAQRLLEEDARTCRAIGAAGLPLIPEGARVLTHCNTGVLATGGCGTALGVIRAAAAAGSKPCVIAGETRPFLQGARLTAWELQRDGIPVEVIADNVAGHLMQQCEIDLVLVGADRIARNGDVANKIGTYTLAVLSRAHRIPFYVAAPLSSFDPEAADGSTIPIEERGRDEVASFGERRVVPDGVPVRHPAFDVTPARLVTAIVTERGVLRPPYEDSLGVYAADV